MAISAAELRTAVPFVNDKNNPMSEKLYSCLERKNIATGGSRFIRNEFSQFPLIQSPL